MVKAGAILFSYCITLANPEGAKNFYAGLNLYDVRQFSFLHYTITAILMAAIPALEAYIAYLVIKVLTKIKLANPFTIEISKTIERISYFMLATWIIAIIYNMHTLWLMKRVTGLHEDLVSTDFIFLAGVVFVIAQIFKRGVEIQSENELTV